VKTFTITAAKAYSFRIHLKILFCCFYSGKFLFADFLSNYCKSIVFNKSSQSAKLEQGSSQGLLEYISTSDDNPVSAQLTAVDGAGKIPTWLTVNGKFLNGIRYTTGFGNYF
jgi:hypothetical protein